MRTEFCRMSEMVKFTKGAEPAAADALVGPLDQRGPAGKSSSAQAATREAWAARRLRHVQGMSAAPIARLFRLFEHRSRRISTQEAT